MSDQQHEAEDWLSQKIKDTIGVDLSINAKLAVSITKDPNNWVKSPENQGEGGKSDEELAGRRGASSCSLTSAIADLVDKDNVADPCNDVVSPLLELVAVLGKASKHAGQDHNEVGKDDNGDVVAVETSEEGKVEEEKWSSDGPVDVAGPEELAVDVLNVADLGDLVPVGVLDVLPADAVVGGHGKVGDSGGGGDEGGDDVEETLLLL